MVRFEPHVRVAFADPDCEEEVHVRINSLFGKGLVAAATLATALTMSACGSDSKSENTGGVKIEKTTATQAAIPTPAQAELQAIMDQIVDPAIPAENKTGLVEGGAEAPELFTEVANLAKENNAKIMIGEINPNANTVDRTGEHPLFEAPTQLILGDGTTVDDAPPVKFVNIDGRWMVSKAYACSMISVFKQGAELPAACAGVTQ